jgi:hypothetical protein
MSPDEQTQVASMMDGATELQEGYAEIGDVKLITSRPAMGRKSFCCTGSRVLVRLAAADRAARGGRVSGGRPRHARLQPVIEARGL